MSDNSVNLSEPKQNDTISSTSQQVIVPQSLQTKNCIIEADRNKTFPISSSEEHAERLANLNVNLQSPANQIVKSIGNATPNATTQNKNINKTQANHTDKLVNDCTNSASPKRNAMKKENHKLHLQMPNNVQQNTATLGHPKMVHTAVQPPFTREYSPNTLRYERPPVQEFFTKFISPMYAPTNSRYLENLKYHPNYKFANNTSTQAPQQSGSVPNSPAYVSRPQFQSGSFPSSPIMVPEPNSPRYLQNAMQHPLLSQTFSPGLHNNISISQYSYVTNYWVPYFPNFLPLKPGNQLTPQNKKKRGKKPEPPVVFEPYLPLKEVEAGLKANSLIEGVIRINPKQYQHAYISSIDKSEQDIFVDGIKNRNRALEGDVVIVKVLPNEVTEVEENKETTNRRGKVVYIKELVHRRTCIGTLKLMADMNRQKALFVPRDNRIPRLYIPFTSWPNNFYNEAAKYENVLFSAVIEEWNHSKYANGKIVCQIGLAGNMEAERKAILAETDLDITPFGPEFRHLYPRLDYTIPDREISIRQDCRKMCIFSIDPLNCRDIDDAVSCIKLNNGNYEVGIHISDVAHFLTEGTKLDEKVAEKATTIYLIEKAYHMLPDDLCMLCSLFPGVDKLAFSVFWEMTENAKIISHRFAKTVINSCCQLAYEHAQAVLDEKVNAEASFPKLYNGFTYSDVANIIKILGKFSSVMRQKRFETGALRIDQPKLQFTLNTTDGMPKSYEICQSKESHQLIEEFMLLANMTVARKIINFHSELAFLRNHPPPNPYMLRQLGTMLKAVGIELDISSAGNLYRTLLPHLGPESTDKGKVMVLSMLCAKPMARAKYFCAGDVDAQDFHHYALNVPLYTHFTSPIRRYADIMVHRLLSACLKYRKLPEWDTDFVKQIATQCNKQKFNAKKAGELSTELFILKYIEMHTPMITEAAVVEVREKYIDFIIVAMGLNRRMFFSNDFPGKYERIRNEAGSKLAKMQVTWNATKELPSVVQVIEVFSVVKIEMYQDESAKVAMRLVRPQ